MADSDIVHDEFTLTREYPATPGQVFRAFSDPERKRRWFAEGEGFIVGSYELDFRTGGHERTAFRVANPEFSSEEIRNDTHYFDIIPNERIIQAYSMANMGKVFSASLQTITLEETDSGTLLTLHEQVTFLAGADGTDMRRAGSAQLLEALARELQAG